MKKIIILIPVFNDWDSLKKLVFEIDQNIKSVENFSFDCLVINDASTTEKPKLTRPKKLKSLKILNMKKNKGHARCNAFGIRYVEQNYDFDFLILMDGDGEDRPQEINSFLKKIERYPDNSVVAKRIKRSEGPIFQMLYSIHKLITFVFTGKKIKFGNYTCLTKRDVKKVSSEASLWGSYSGTLKKNIERLNEIDSIRGKRYFGPSKMSLFKLILHSFSIIAVFKNQVFLRAFLIILSLYFFYSLLGIFSIFAQLLIFVFSLSIFLVSLRENKQQLINSRENLKDIEEI